MIRFLYSWCALILTGLCCTSTYAEDDPYDFWAFKPVQQDLTIPKVSDPAWAANPIDAFILHGLEEAGLTPAAPASKSTLIRRAYYDLTGLPPTPEQVKSFAADESPEAYEKVIDSLLASTQYGEKWARHWLDLVRYADSNGYERDSNKPFIWRYRDYVIDAFNSDKPYDQFIREQLAGDEMDPATPETITATGYYRVGTWDDEPADPAQNKFDELDDIVRTTSEVFLGLTIGCARCHDHKIDPITQKDYYQFLSFFHNIKPLTRSKDFGILKSILTPEKQAEHDTKLADKQKQESKAVSELTALLDSFKATATPEHPDWFQDNQKQKDLIKRFTQHGTEILGADQAALFTKVQAEIKRIRAIPIPTKQASAVSEHGSVAPDTFIMLRGNPHSPGEKVEPGFPQLLVPPEPVLPEGSPEKKTSYRRTVLANWIASPDNPMTARVIMNRLWQHHFGRGIVRSTSDMGKLGNRPTHPELLDWLATELIADDWKLKSLHKKIMLSRSYQLSSQGNEKALAQDPANDLFWRFNMRRLTAEEIRDTMLMASDALNLKSYGPTIFPKLPDEVLATSSKKADIVSTGTWGISTPEEANRRSIYIHLKRSLIHPMLSTFDFADLDSSCPVRFVTTQPAQALGLLNSVFAHEQAQLLHARIQREHTYDIDAQLARAFELCTGRLPTGRERDMSHSFVRELQAKNNLTLDQALERYCLLTLNLNEFIYLD